MIFADFILLGIVTLCVVLAIILLALKEKKENILAVEIALPILYSLHLLYF